MLEFAGFVDDAGEFVDHALATERTRVGDANEGQMGALEEFFHVFGAAAGVVLAAGVGTFVDFDGADGAKSAFVAENEIDGVVLDKTISFVAVLATDFVTEEGGNFDARDDIESLAENVVQKLETVLFGANHELFLWPVTTAIHGVAAVIGGGNAS